ncbi:hypothetical protein NPIL_117781 [Nephila pilipes]|uniref:Uncharacterized protein n=1 Tax=Nephila pilipes TaxID=299642 RepID=A0A8X6PBH9_NEPPI|nr:hypothetical protein NPIL_117781 [Nephila pilipes]
MSLVNREICFIKGGLTKLERGGKQSILLNKRSFNTLHEEDTARFTALLDARLAHDTAVLPPFPPMTCVQTIPKRPTFTTTPAVEGSVRREKKSTK